MDADETQRQLINTLLTGRGLPHAVARVEHRETHISHVLLAGDTAYKIKKPLDLGFLDFSALADRRRYCHEEVRLNGRLAPQVYRDVAAITGSPDEPVIAGDDDPIEYAVVMRRFDEAGLFDRLAAQDALGREPIDTLADHIAAFHQAADATPPSPDLGTGEAALVAARENFDHLRPRVDTHTRGRLEALADWTDRRYHELADVFARRRRDGRVRECHGDMHLANIAFIDGEPAIFDGIEFNARMRWIDVAADIAFLIMDLDRRGLDHLASRLLDRWLAATGDYDALHVLGFYWVYRALVRAKIAAIRLDQVDDSAEAAAWRDDITGYIGLAERYAAGHGSAVVLTRGVAGSGKSAAALALAERIGGVRLRADVERRRLYPDADPAVRYAPAAHDAVYARLLALTREIVEAGFPAIVDATFLERERRMPFVELAEQRNVPWRILDLDLPESTLAERITARQRAGNDASEAGVEVMRAQRQRLEPLDAQERAGRLHVDNAGDAPVVPETGLPHGRGLRPLAEAQR